MRHNPGYGIMAKFMEDRAVIVDLIVKRRLWRNANGVQSGNVTGNLAANLKAGTCCSNQGLGAGNNLALLVWWGSWRNLLRQTITLRNIEHRIAFEKRDGLRVATLLACPFLFVFRNEAIGITDGPALLALADTAAKFKRLFECEPTLRGIAAPDHRMPQEKNIDAGIGLGCSGIARQSKASTPLPITPRLNPWHDALFKLGNNPVCHL